MKIRLEQIIVKEIAGETIHKFITAEKIESNDEERSIIGWGSKPTIDRDKELILSDAWKLDNYKKNPVVLLAHKYDTLPVGKSIWVKADGTGLRFKCRFASTERGQEVYQLYKEGILNAFSVGFTPNEGGFIDNPSDPKYKGIKRLYRDVNLLEISCVSVPAHPDALVEFVKSGKVINKQLKEELEAIIEIEDNPVKTIDEVMETDSVKEIDEVVKTEIVEEKQVGIIKLDTEAFDKFTEQIENMNQVIKLLADKVEVLEEKKEANKETVIEEKVYSPEGMPSIYDIMSACNRALRGMSEEQGKMNGMDSMPTGYVVDLFPDNYPDGSMVYCMYEEGKSCYYRVNYDYDMLSKEVEINTEPESVQQSWVVDKYNLEEKEMDEFITKEGRMLSDKNRKLISDCMESMMGTHGMLKGLMDMTEKPKDIDEDDLETKSDEDDEEIEIEEIETKNEDEIEIDEDALTEALTKMTKTFAESFKNSNLVGNAFKKIQGKTI